jgi:hypothetical protein
VGGTVSGHHASPQMIATVKQAFVSALSTGLTVGAVVTLLGAGVAWALIQSRPRPQAVPQAEKLTAEDAARELNAA